MPAQKTERLEARVASETIEAIGYLARKWGGVRPLNKTQVIEEAIRRAVEAEKKIGRKS